MSASSNLQSVSSSVSSSSGGAEHIELAKYERTAFKILWRRLFHAYVDQTHTEWMMQALQVMPPFLRFEMPLASQGEQQLNWVEIRTRMKESKNLQTISSLQLASMKLPTLPPEMSLFSQLKTLDFSNQGVLQGVTILPSSIGDLTMLVKLDVSGNQLADLPDSIGNLTALKILFASGNCFAKLPDTFCQLQSLEYLDLARNLLESLPDSIGDCQQLKEVGLSSNRLTQLPPSFFSLKRLQKAFFSSNRFVDIPKEITFMGLDVYAFDGNPIFTGAHVCPASPSFGSPPDLFNEHPLWDESLDTIQRANEPFKARRKLFSTKESESKKQRKL